MPMPFHNNSDTEKKTLYLLSWDLLLSLARAVQSRQFIQALLWFEDSCVFCFHFSRCFIIYLCIFVNLFEIRFSVSYFDAREAEWHQRWISATFSLPWWFHFIFNKYYTKLWLMRRSLSAITINKQWLFSRGTKLYSAQKRAQIKNCKK